MPPESPFDRYAADYDKALDRGLSISGENKDYFARGRITWIARRLRQLCVAPASVMDFGCGVGAAAPLLLDLLSAREVLGVEPSRLCVEEARKMHAHGGIRFRTTDAYAPDGSFDLAYCNGVFHHIPAGERDAAVGYIFEALRPGGLFALWENNPWNPGTRLVMSRIPFDRDAVTLTPPHARRLLRRGGFEIIRTDALFLFPGMLRCLRWIEPLVCRWPLGAQYMVLARKPETVDP